MVRYVDAINKIADVDTRSLLTKNLSYQREMPQT